MNGNALKVQLDFSEAGVLDVNLQNMSEIIRNYLNTLTTESNASIFGLNTASEDSPSLVTVLRDALKDMDVNVTNNYFDDLLQKMCNYN